MVDQQVGGTTEQQTVRRKTKLLDKETEMVASYSPHSFD
jgi:hypothetical protein